MSVSARAALARTRESSEPAIHLDGVRAGYGDHVAIDDVDLEVPAGRVVALIGPNGAGKTTLFRVLAGLLRPMRGSVKLLGEAPRRRGWRHTVAYVPQQGDVDAAYPVSVLDVVLMGRYAHVGWLRRPGRRDRAAATQALERVGLADLADRSFGALSGGQRQRVVLARALAQDARVVLLDEPFTGVDATTQEIVFNTLRSLAREGRSLLVATHDIGSVHAFADEVVLVNRRIVAAGRVDDVLTPANLQAAFGGRLVLFGANGAGAGAADEASAALIPSAAAAIADRSPPAPSARALRSAPAPDSEEVGT